MTKHCGYLLVVLLTGCAHRPMPAAVVVARVAAAGLLTADISTTAYVMHTCPVCIERNPLVRPIVRLGPLPTLALGAGLNVAAWYGGEAFRRTRLGRHTWWVIPLAVALGSSYGAWSNIHTIQSISR